MDMRQNARLTPLGRERLVGLIEAGFSFLRQHWPAVLAPRRRRSRSAAYILPSKSAERTRCQLSSSGAAMMPSSSVEKLYSLPSKRAE